GSGCASLGGPEPARTAPARRASGGFPPAGHLRIFGCGHRGGGARGARRLSKGIGRARPRSARRGTGRGCAVSRRGGLRSSGFQADGARCRTSAVQWRAPAQRLACGRGSLARARGRRGRRGARPGGGGDSMTARYSVGIDLGTTHCALAIAPLDPEDRTPSRLLPVPQLVTRHETESRHLLPSFLYLATRDEGPLPLPWDAQRTFAVGQYARERAAEAPTRVVASAKSWLSHTGVDRRSGILPLGAPEDIEKISPVEASFRYLDHLAEAWATLHAGGDVPPLAEQHIVLTVPASFDAA